MIKLFNFLECFNEATEICILDEAGNILAENQVGDVTQRIMNQRVVVSSQCEINKLTVITTKESAEEQDKSVQTEDETGKMVMVAPDDIDLFHFMDQLVKDLGNGNYICNGEFVRKQIIYRPIHFSNVAHAYEVFDILESSWGGWNECPDSTKMKIFAEKWEKDFGAELFSLSHDTLGFRCKRKLCKSEIDKLISEILEIPSNCIDIYEGKVELLEKDIFEEGQFFLWWD